MTKKVFTLICALFMALSLACILSAGGKQAPSASKKAADLKVTDHRQVEDDNARLLSLSPDGKWFFAENQDGICIYEAGTLNARHCIQWKGRVDTWSVTWSSDSNQVAFTEDVYKFMYESDLWVLDVQSGNMTDLTNDNLDGGKWLTERQEGQVVNLDTVPAWSPDRKTLVFARTIMGDVSQTYLYRIPASGGDPEKLVTVKNDYPLAVWHNVRWSGDGKQIVYTVAVQKTDDPGNGIWIVDKDGSNPRHMLGVSEELGTPILLDVATKGNNAFIQYPMALQAQIKPNLSYCMLLDLKTGDVSPLKQAAGDDPEFNGPVEASFSPDGSKIAYTYTALGSVNERRLVVRDVAGGAEEILYTSSNGELSGGSAGLGPGLFWAQNDTLYVMNGPGNGWLFTLGSK